MKIFKIMAWVIVLAFSFSAWADDKKQDASSECDPLQALHEKFGHSRIFDKMRRDMDRLLSDDDRMFDHELFSMDGSHWFPAVDIQHKDKEIIITVDVPGVDAKTMDISIEDGMLVIKGERKHESGVTEKDYRRMERSYGSFYRSFSLPADAEPDKIKAKSKDGVLVIKIPRTGSSTAKKITIEE